MSAASDLGRGASKTDEAASKCWQHPIWTEVHLKWMELHSSTTSILFGWRCIQASAASGLGGGASEMDRAASECQQHPVWVEAHPKWMKVHPKWMELHPNVSSI